MMIMMIDSTKYIYIYIYIYNRSTRIVLSVYLRKDSVSKFMYWMTLVYETGKRKPTENSKIKLKLLTFRGPNPGQNDKLSWLLFIIVSSDWKNKEKIHKLFFIYFLKYYSGKK